MSVEGGHSVEEEYANWSPEGQDSGYDDRDTESEGSRPDNDDTTRKISNPFSSGTNRERLSSAGVGSTENAEPEPDSVDLEADRSGPSIEDLDAFSFAQQVRGLVFGDIKTAGSKVKEMLDGFSASEMSIGDREKVFSLIASSSRTGI
ncbi:MAG: hypothetical protein ABIJ46_05080 [bacterium]